MSIDGPTYLSRRRLIGGMSALVGGSVLTGCSDAVPPNYSNVLALTDGFTRTMQELLLPKHPLVEEFDRSKISKVFPFGPGGEHKHPEHEDYDRLLHGQFKDWRLEITGLVKRPLSISLADLHRLPSKTQITQMHCVAGWTGIGEWTGVSLARLLWFAGVLPTARFVASYGYDGWWDCFPLVDATHPQTLISYALNGEPLSIAHGGPARVKMEHQLGYRSLKYVYRMELVDKIDHVMNGEGSYAHGKGFSWHAGI